MKILKASLFAVTAFATAIGVSVPAFAGGTSHVSIAVGGSGYGYYGGGRHYNNSYYRGGRGFRGNRGYYGGRGFRGNRGYGGRGYRGHRGYRRGGGRGAAIALGVIGGAIILNELAEEDRRRQGSRDRYENRRYRSYDPRRDDYYYERGVENSDGDASNADLDRREAELARREAELARREAEILDRTDRDFNREDARRDRPRAVPSDPVERDTLDDELLGASGSNSEAVTFSVRTAYRDCAAEARRAASRDGQFVAMPAEPTSVQALSPTLVRLTADLTAQDQRGRNFLRTLTCEAEADRITFLRLS